MLGNSKGVINLFIVLILVAGLTAAYFYFRPKTPDYSNRLKDTYSNIETPAPKAPRDWPVYVNNKIQLQLKYPTDWIIKNSNWDEGILQFELGEDDLVILRYTEPDQPPHGGFPYGASVAIKTPSPNPENKSALEWIKQTLSGDIEVKTETISINGINAAKATTEFDGTNINALIPYKGKMYRILINYFENQEQPQKYYNYKKVFDQILSSIKFLE